MVIGLGSFQGVLKVSGAVELRLKEGSPSLRAGAHHATPQHAENSESSLNLNRGP